MRTPHSVLSRASAAFTFLVAAATCVACAAPAQTAKVGAAPSPGPAALAPSPSPLLAADLPALLAREGTAPLHDFRVRAADGAIELHVLAAAPPKASTKRENDAAYTIASFSIGAETDVVCTATNQNIDLSHWVATTVAKMEATLTKMPTTGVEVVAGRPVFRVDTDGVVVQDGKQKRNLAKFAAVQLDHGVVACVHDDPGYDETFRKAMRHIATRAVTPDVEKPARKVIAVVREGERVVGFDVHQTYAGSKPGEVRETRQGTGIMTSEDRWFAVDAGWSAIVDKEGVVRERSMQRIGAVTTVDMSLERKGKGAFAYEGTVDGAAKKGTFRVKAPLVTSVSRASALLAFARDTKKEQMALWHFDERTPDAAVKTTVRRGAGGALRLEENDKVFRCALASSGLCTTVIREGSDFVVEVVYEEGRP